MKSRVSLSERLEALSRLEEADKRVFTRQLGKLASELEPECPLHGVRRIVDESGLQNVWEKRKRYFHLPDELADQASQNTVLASTPGTFVALAKAAGRLLSGSDVSELREQEEHRAVRVLCYGSSFLPDWQPASPSERSAKALLMEYATRVSEAAVDRTRISDLWHALEKTPAWIELFETEREAAEQSLIYGAAELVPEEVLWPTFYSHWRAGRFRPGIGNGSYWSHPKITIGRLVGEPETAEVYFIPEEMRNSIRYDDLRGRYIVPDGVVEWIEQAERQEISVIKMADVTLVLHPSASKPNKAVLSLDVSGSGILFGEWALATSLSKDRREIATAACEAFLSSKGKRRQFVRCSNPDLLAIHETCIEPDDETCSEVVAIFDLLHFGDAGGSLAWVEEFTDPIEGEMGADLMMHLAPFLPTIEGQRPAPGPIREGTIGAWLLDNARFAPEGERYSDLLIRKADVTAVAGLRFLEALIEPYKSALKTI